MSTQGIISIIKEGQVIFKCVAGCDGQNAPEAAKAIKALNPATLEELHKACIDHKFGCFDCLVVQNSDRHLDGSGDELPSLYKIKFKDPKFNPRWERGTAAYTEIIEL